MTQSEIIKEIEEGKFEEVKIGLKRSSWEIIIKVIHNNTIKSESNFWAAIQSIEGQLEEK